MSTNGTTPTPDLFDGDDSAVATAIAIISSYVERIMELEEERDRLVMGMMIALAERDEDIVINEESAEMHSLYFEVHNLRLTSEVTYNEDGEPRGLRFSLDAFDEDDSAGSGQE